MAYITKNELAQYYKNNEYYQKEYPTERRMKNAIDRRYKAFEEIWNTPLVKKITVEMEWTKNKTWGMNPHATAYVTYIDGTSKRFDGYKASGYGYDKSLHLLEQILNDTAKQNLLIYPREIFIKPNSYKLEGIGGVDKDAVYLPYYSLGSEIGFNFEIDHVAEGKTYDKFIIRFKNSDGKMYAHRTAPHKHVTHKKPCGTKCMIGKYNYLKNSARRML